MKDERIEKGINKIRAEFSVIAYYIVCISALVKVFYFGMDFKSIITEYIILIACPVYQLIRGNMLKINMWETEKGRGKYRKLVWSLIVLAIVTLGYIYVWYIKKSFDVEGIINYIVFVLCFIVAAFLMEKYKKYISKKYNDQFSDCEK